MIYFLVGLLAIGIVAGLLTIICVIALLIGEIVVSPF